MTEDLEITQDNKIELILPIEQWCCIQYFFFCEFNKNKEQLNLVVDIENIEQLICMYEEYEQSSIENAKRQQIIEFINAFFNNINTLKQNINNYLTQLPLDNFVTCTLYVGVFTVMQPNNQQSIDEIIKNYTDFIFAHNPRYKNLVYGVLKNITKSE